MNFLHELKWRGLLHQTAGDGIEAHLAEPRVAYCGFDPTADSLTVGNLLAIQMMRRWQLAGHQPIVLLGGGTGLVGDPSGKDDERKLQSHEMVAHNIEKQRRIFTALLDFDKGKNRALLLNNHDWLKDLTFIGALRDIGKHFSVNQMVQRDSVKARLHNREQGVSYTEFSYMLLQAYDFLHLYRAHNCSVQLAGSDQYGNIVSGMDLIRRCCGDAKQPARAFGVTNKLVTRADGGKIGKTESGAVWLGAEKTSPYKFYQFWLNTDDADVIQFLKWFTFLDAEQIAELEQSQARAAHERAAQRKLAEVLTELVHGRDALAQAAAASAVLFGGGDLTALDARTLEELFADAPSRAFDKSELGRIDLASVLAQTGLAESKTRAREFIKAGAVSVNNQKVGEQFELGAAHLLHGHSVLIRRGKKHWAVARWK